MRRCRAGADARSRIRQPCDGPDAGHRGRCASPGRCARCLWRRAGPRHARYDYAWLDHTLAGRRWSAGDAFTLADAAAAPSLFYADWVHPIGADRTTLKAYRARLLGRPSIARCIDERVPIGASSRSALLIGTDANWVVMLILATSGHRRTAGFGRDHRPWPGQARPGRGSRRSRARRHRIVVNDADYGGAGRCRSAQTQ